MRREPKVKIILDLADGEPPITCGSLPEALFLADIARAAEGDADALGRLRERYPPQDSDTALPQDLP